MQSSAKLNELPEELRGRKRSRVLLAATVEAGGQHLKANLLNLSTTGAQLDATVPPAIDTELTLSRGTLEARGRVIWVSEHRFGVAFDAPIEEAVVTEHIDAITPRKKVVPFR
jgi:PilZ domain